MAAKPLPSVELLRQLFEYDPKTGLLVWRKRPECSRCWNTRYAGKIAGSATHSYGYSTVSINGSAFLVHRVVWAIHYGKEPEGELDHINGKNNDNRIANLRDVNHTNNQRNMKRNSANTSGVTGVFWNKKNRRWRSSIKYDGKAIDLGCYRTIEEAAEARRSAEIALGFHRNHGRR